ncbi:MAG: M48 family metallopeptidase [Woeseiaceae bacterium]|nr:M48 family metallopeptidase [Woeseiaceae bacterium]
MRQLPTSIMICLATALLAYGCASSPTGRSQLMLVSPEAAVVESRKAYVSTVQQLDAEDKLLDDPMLADRLQVITGRLVAVAVEAYPHTRDWDWSVALIDEASTVNAWCMAGGRMAVYSGLFEKARLDDDELAQIMGHEISHALANHTAERMSVVLASSAGVIAAGAAADRTGIVLAGAELAAKLAIELPNSRQAETEADRIGIELATRAGYDPAAAVTLWAKMEDAAGTGPVEFLSTHPAPGNRRETLGAMVPVMRETRPAEYVEPRAVTIIRHESDLT